MLVWARKRILDCCVWENISRNWNHSQTWIRVKELHEIKPMTMPDSDPVLAVTSDRFRTYWCFKVDEFKTAWQGREMWRVWWLIQTWDLVKQDELELGPDQPYRWNQIELKATKVKFAPKAGRPGQRNHREQRNTSGNSANVNYILIQMYILSKFLNLTFFV